MTDLSDLRIEIVRQTTKFALLYVKLEDLLLAIHFYQLNCLSQKEASQIWIFLVQKDRLSRIVCLPPVSAYRCTSSSKVYLI